MAIAASIGGAFIQAFAAKKAAKAQTASANQDIAFQKETRDIIRNDLSPYRTGGADAQRAMNFELGLGARPTFGAAADGTGGTVYGGFTKTPGYDFRLQQGQDSLQASAAARGGLYSGATMRDSLKFGQDYVSNEYGNYLSRLGAQASSGMNAASMSVQASQYAAGNVSNALADRGNAISAGYVGVGKAINGGIDNALGAWNYQKNMTAAPQYGGGR